MAPKVEFEPHAEPINAIETGVVMAHQLGVAAMYKRSDILTYQFTYNEEMHLCCGHHHELFDREHTAITQTELEKHKYAPFAFHLPNMIASHDCKLHRSSTANSEESPATLALSANISASI